MIASARASDEKIFGRSREGVPPKSIARVKGSGGWAVLAPSGGSPSLFHSAQKQPRWYDILSSMRDVCTILSPVQQGDIWRVRIGWPNGGVSYFGKFTSEKEAMGWIYGHASLTKPHPLVFPPRVEKEPGSPG